jgi:transcriptional regulator with XRE-family HTH domain
MKNEKLYAVRKSRGLSQMQMAQKAAMEQTTYSRKEMGKSPITDEEWEKFAKVLNTTVDEIKDSPTGITVKNKNCTFSDNAVAGVQYISIPQEVLDTVLRYNKKLEEEIQSLKQEISRLV